jgi:DNA (cytosine-5)-methyltransferase 1
MLTGLFVLCEPAKRQRALTLARADVEQIKNTLVCRGDMREIGFISLFSGAGGLDIGLEAAGFRCLYAADIDRSAYLSLLANAGRQTGHLNYAVIEQADVSRQTGDMILSRVGAKRGQIPLLVGGPPCQSWSSAGHQKGWHDPRGRLFDDFVRLARELDVRWLMFENVRGLLTARGPDGVPGSALALIRAKLLSAGFQTQVTLANAADYGVPQRRVRLVVFGYRIGNELPFPLATHGKTNSKHPWISTDEALANIAPVDGDEIIRANPLLHAQLSELQPGTGIKSPGKKEATRPGGHWGYKQGAFVADTSLPARTVTANAQQDWVRDPKFGIRRLSPRECAALQTFPHDWVFVGSRRDQYRLIGNAVPPLLAGQIGKALHAHIIESWDQRAARVEELEPLAPKLAAAISYTQREERRNGASRRQAPQLRKTRSTGARLAVS